MHANEEPREEISLPIKGHGSQAAFVPAPACPRGLTGRAPSSQLAGSTSTAQGPILSCPANLTRPATSPLNPEPTPVTVHMSPGLLASSEGPAKPTTEPQTGGVEPLDSKDAKID